MISGPVDCRRVAMLTVKATEFCNFRHCPVHFDLHQLPVAGAQLGQALPLSKDRTILGGRLQPEDEPASPASDHFHDLRAALLRHPHGIILQRNIQ